MHGGFNPKSSTLRLYAKWKEEGQGLVSVSTTVQDETMNIHEYIRKMAPMNCVLSEYLRQQKTKKDGEDEESSWKDRPLHGMYHQQIEEVADIRKSYPSLVKPGLKDTKYPHSKKIWPRSGIKPALLVDFWHDKTYVIQIWARPGIDGTVYVMACHIWVDCGLVYVAQAHRKQVWPGSGTKLALLTDWSHGRVYVNQMWARSDNDGTVYAMACHNWFDSGMGYVAQAHRKQVWPG